MKMPKKETSTKVETVIALASRKSGVTLDEIAERLNVSRVAAASLIADARRKGVKVRFEVEDGRYRV
jgi:DNA-binding transcriptional regulator LsrR (DeoR family)